jgi:hypothetical protein
MVGVLETQQRSQRGRPVRPQAGGDGRARILKFVIIGAAVIALGILLFRYFRGNDSGVSSESVTVRIHIDPSLSARVDLREGRLGVTVLESAAPVPESIIGGAGDANRVGDAGGGLDFPMEISIEGLKRLIDGLGGILINIPETIEYRGPDGLPVRIDAGMRRLDADRVESYLRRRSASRPASLRAVVLGVTSRASELMVSGVNLDRILEAALEPAARGTDGRNGVRLAALLRSASSLGPTEISVEWGSAPRASEIAGGGLAGSAAPAGSAAAAASATPETAADAGVPSGAPGTVSPGSRVTSPMKVRILNGTGKPGLAARAAFNLPSPRFEVVETANADRFGYVRTIVRSADAAAAQEIIGILGVGRVEVKPGETLRGADVEVILGTDARSRW